MSLRSQLRRTIDELERAKLLKLREQQMADIEKVRKERENISDFVSGIATKITEQIGSGKVPRVKVSDYNKEKWIREAQTQKAKHQDIWAGFIAYLASEDLEIKVIEAHDGVGIKSWIELSVQPINVE